MKEQMIRDTDYANALSELGFCVAPLFSQAQIDKLQALYAEFEASNNVTGLVASHSKGSTALSLYVSNSIKEILSPSLEHWFKDFNFFLGGFMVKSAHTEEEFPLHQDWDILDETKYTSYQIWIPLELSSPYNGGIIALPGSHRFFNNHRSGSYGMPRVKIDDVIRPHIVDMVIAPGSALVYHNSLFHASYANPTNKTRVSAIINIYQKDAVLEYAHKNTAENCTEKYAITSESFLTHLNVFEQGKIPDHMMKSGDAAIDTYSNASTTSEALVQQLNLLFPETLSQSLEPAQLHVLKDKDIQTKLNKEGYVILDFIDNTTIEILKEKYNELCQEHKTDIGRFSTLEHVSPEIKRSLHHFILEQTQAQLDQYFKDYQSPISCYFTKYANSTGNLTWHNDTPIILNTHLEPYLGIWCPLLDVSEQNGGFCLIPHSHKFSHSPFVAGIQWPFAIYNDLFTSIGVVPTISAGQMILFDLRLIHNATPNMSDQDRVVVCIRLTHNKSVYHSFKSKDSEKQSIEVFEEKPNHFLSDEWSGEEQVSKLARKVGEMEHIYTNLKVESIAQQLAVES